jgi:hypothetical protein
MAINPLKQKETGGALPCHFFVPLKHRTKQVSRIGDVLRMNGTEVGRLRGMGSAGQHDAGKGRHLCLDPYFLLWIGSISLPR